MANIHIEKRPQWLRIKPGGHEEIDRFSQNMVGQAAEDAWVLIGQWYYYLFSHDTCIDLCRTKEKVGQPSLTEVMKPGELAISDDDLECAVHYETSGFTEPGTYRISSLIERKLRILFE